MRELRRRPAQGLVEPQLGGRVGEVLVAADDVRDAHVVVVDHAGEVVGRPARGLQDDEVLEHGVLEDDMPADDIVDRGLALIGQAQPDGGLAPLGLEGLALLLAQGPAAAAVPREELLREGLLPGGLDLADGPAPALTRALRDEQGRLRALRLGSRGEQACPRDRQLVLGPGILQRPRSSVRTTVLT